MVRFFRVFRVFRVLCLIFSSVFLFLGMYNLAGGTEADPRPASWREDIQGFELPSASFSPDNLRAHAFDDDRPGLPRSTSRAYVPGPEHLPPDVWRIIRGAAHAHGVPEMVLGKLCMSESSGRRLLVAGPNKNGSYDLGPFGFNSRWLGWYWEKYGVFDPFDFAESADAAARVLYDHYRIFGNWVDSVAAYKAGRSRVLAGREGWEVRTIAREVAR